MRGDYDNRGFRRNRQDIPQTASGACQQGSKEHHRHYAQILENQYAESGLAVRRIDLTGVHQQLHQYRGTGQGDQKSEKEGLPEREPE